MVVIMEDLLAHQAHPLVDLHPLAHLLLDHHHLANHQAHQVLQVIMAIITTILLDHPLLDLHPLVLLLLAHPHRENHKLLKTAPSPSMLNEQANLLSVYLRFHKLKM
uniref:Uncharacterized protein n=1 Tax=Graphocephala atropunctata TaxID=36148 RepID=A0A1B6MUZ6_9HEMI